MRSLRAVILAMALAVGITPASAQNPPPDAAVRSAGEERAINLCSTCHGPRGISTSPEFPILAAQRPGYIAAQLENFQKKTREEKAAHDFMYGIAGNLNSATIESIAAYYSSQPAAPGRPGDPGADRGSGRNSSRRGYSIAGFRPACPAMGRRRRRRRLSSLGRAACKVCDAPDRVHPGPRPQGARNARHRQGSHARRDRCCCRLRAVALVLAHARGNRAPSRTNRTSPLMSDATATDGPALAGARTDARSYRRPTAPSGRAVAAGRFSCRSARRQRRESPRHLCSARESPAPNRHCRAYCGDHNRAGDRRVRSHRVMPSRALQKRQPERLPWR